VTTIEELEDAREDLESLLSDVLISVLGEEAYPTEDPLAPGPIASAHLAAHDQIEHSYLGIQIRLGAVLARILAGRMMSIGDPGPDDLVDTVGELGNILGGNVKTLFFQSARLSLPVAELGGAGQVFDQGIRVAASVFGQAVELLLQPDISVDDLYWPPSMRDEVLEG
jgi:hypothetical protein